MRKLTYYVASSIDGFIGAPDGSADAFTTTGDHMTTIATEYPDTLPVHIRSHFGVAADAPNRHFDAVLMGRRTYEPTIDAGLTNAFPHLRNYVFSTTLEVDDPTVTVVASDPLATVCMLKQDEGQGIWLCGGGALAGQLLPEIDELIVKFYPVLLGSGIPMIASGYDPSSFRLTATMVHDNGVAFMTYRRV